MQTIALFIQICLYCLLDATAHHILPDLPCTKRGKLSKDEHVVRCLIDFLANATGGRENTNAENSCVFSLD